MRESSIEKNTLSCSLWASVPEPRSRSRLFVIFPSYLSVRELTSLSIRTNQLCKHAIMEPENEIFEIPCSDARLMAIALACDVSLKEIAANYRIPGRNGKFSYVVAAHAPTSPRGQKRRPRPPPDGKRPVAPADRLADAIHAERTAHRSSPA